MIGQSVGSDANPLSCFLFRPRKSRERRRKRSHTNVSNTLVTRPSTPPTQTAHVRFHERKWVHTLGFAQKITHNGLHAETGAFRMGVVSLPSEHSARSRTSPGRVSERHTLPLLGLGRGCSRRTQKAFGTAMRLCASLFRRRRGPAGLRRPTPPAERTVLAPISPRVQLCLRRPAFPLSAFIRGA